VRCNRFHPVQRSGRGAVAPDENRCAADRELNDPAEA